MPPKELEVTLNGEKKVAFLIEKPKKGTKSLVNTGLYFLDRRIFKTKLTKSERGEFELTQAVENFAKKIKTWVIQANDWIPLSYPWDLLRANQFLLKQQKRHIEQRFLNYASTRHWLLCGN